MATEPVVINTGPLITLFRIDALDVAGKLPLDFIAPRAVRLELDEGVAVGYPYHDKLIEAVLLTLGEE